MNPASPPPTAQATAALSLGASTAAVIRWASDLIRSRAGPISTLVDIGCGQGDLAAALRQDATRCIGVDLVRYPGLESRPWIEFRSADLNHTPFPVESNCADVAAAIETIEHLENPRALIRELARIARPGGWVVVTTPNQLSWLSKLSLVCKHQFTAFQEAPGLYPTHITALLAADLRHIGAECGLTGLEIHFSGIGRMPGTSRPYPVWVRRRWPRGASDNVMLLGKKL